MVPLYFVGKIPPTNFFFNALLEPCVAATPSVEIWRGYSFLLPSTKNLSRRDRKQNEATNISSDPMRHRDQTS